MLLGEFLGLLLLSVGWLLLLLGGGLGLGLCEGVRLLGWLLHGLLRDLGRLGRRLRRSLRSLLDGLLYGLLGSLGHRLRLSGGFLDRLLGELLHSNPLLRWRCLLHRFLLRLCSSFHGLARSLAHGLHDIFALHLGQLEGSGPGLSGRDGIDLSLSIGVSSTGAVCRKSGDRNAGVEVNTHSVLEFNLIIYYLLILRSH